MADFGKPAPLPAPNVEVRIGDKNVRWTAEQIRGLSSNPLYAGIGPFPRHISDEAWVRSAAEAIRNDGTEQFLVNVLYVLRNSFQFTSAADSQDQLGLQDLKAHQRISTVTNSAIPAGDIVQAGLHSARDISPIPDNDFVSDHEEPNQKSGPPKC